jgi:hypothetical protein
MPPDADKLRQRRPVSDNNNTAATVSTRLLLSSMASLQSTDVCIHGDIYDISNFDHPGGDQIQLFGGNDVTVQYHMIHPYHTSKHLEKMNKVGKVADYVCQYVIKRIIRRDNHNDGGCCCCCCCCCVKESEMIIILTATWHFLRRSPLQIQI